LLFLPLPLLDCLLEDLFDDDFDDFFDDEARDTCTSSSEKDVGERVGLDV